MKVEKEVEKIIKPVLENEGIELVGVDFKPRKDGSVLTVYIDRESGVDLDTCAYMSDLISPMIDVHKLIKGRYYLEVSSPGIERPLKSAADFKRFIGKKVAVTTKVEIGNRKNFKGELLRAEDNSFVMLVEGHEIQIMYESVLRARLIAEIRFK